MKAKPSERTSCRWPSSSNGSKPEASSFPPCSWRASICCRATAAGPPIDDWHHCCRPSRSRSLANARDDGQGPSERVAAPEAQDLALERFVLARQAGQHLAAERIDVRPDIVGEGRPELVVDHIDADEAARHPPRRRARLGVRGPRPPE